ncbi:S-adenosyl-L-methionine-dependent methyltransferase [Flagelloscypha sp. PMI_526]|nr:S-adenosyl-L-methionine-dependent methyltransferase [Flagelloscypha sp. PMI_526]
MATFAKPAFNAAIYAASRPTYPSRLWEYVVANHLSKPAAKLDLAVDIGCGTGQATAQIPNFSHVIGIDPSQSMIDKARAAHPQTLDGNRKLEFRHSSAEELSSCGIETGTVDLITAAQACHWFDFSKVWPEVARVLRPSGTFSFWGYSEMRITNKPELTPLINAFWQGSDPRTSLAPHFQRPGRTIVETHLTAVPEPPEDLFEDFKRIYFVGSHHPELPKPHLPVILQKTMPWESLFAYIQSASAYHTYEEKYGEEEASKFAMKFVNDVRSAVGDEVGVEWPLALLVGRRKASE